MDVEYLDLWSSSSLMFDVNPLYAFSPQPTHPRQSSFPSITILQYFPAFTVDHNTTHKSGSPARPSILTPNFSRPLQQNTIQLQRASLHFLESRKSTQGLLQFPPYALAHYLHNYQEMLIISLYSINKFLTIQ
jgi:hypothetical protein